MRQCEATLTPAPFLCWFAVFSAGETQIWPGDLRVVAVVWFSFFSMDLPRGQILSYLFHTILPLLSLSGPSLRARSAATDEKKSAKPRLQVGA